MSALPPAPSTSPTTSAAPETEGLTDSQKRVAVIVGAVIVIGLIAFALWAAITLIQNQALAASVRDVFIIFMALEFMVIGVALVVLVFQLAVLTNMLRHEIKPILESTNETVNTVRGTTLFLSENLTEPIIKLNSYLAGLARAVESLGALGGLFGRKK